MTANGLLVAQWQSLQDNGIIIGDHLIGKWSPITCQFCEFGFSNWYNWFYCLRLHLQNGELWNVSLWFSPALLSLLLASMSVMVQLTDIGELLIINLLYKSTTNMSLNTVHGRELISIKQPGGMKSDAGAIKHMNKCCLEKISLPHSCQLILVWHRRTSWHKHHNSKYQLHTLSTVVFRNYIIG